MPDRLSFPFLALAATTLFVCVPGRAYAQSSAGIRLGVLGGASITSVTGVDVSGAVGSNGEPDVNLKTTSRPGFQLGAYLTVPLTTAMSFQPELHFIQKGAKIVGTSTGIDFGNTVTLSLQTSYVELPLLLRYDVLRQAKAHPFVVFGPSVAYRVSCRTAFSLMGFDLEDTCKPSSEDFGELTEDPIRKTDFGVVGGVGIAGLAGGFPLSAQVRYAHGLTSILKDRAELKSRYKGVSILVGVGFRAR